jgi:hypothetical protein
MKPLTDMREAMNPENLIIVIQGCLCPTSIYTFEGRISFCRCYLSK